MSAYDAMTILTEDQMDKLMWWWMLGKDPIITMRDDEYRGRSIQFSYEDNRVWILPR